MRSEKFSYHQILGNPITQVQRINSWSADELIYIDISDDTHHDLQRDDQKIKSMQTIYEIIETVSKTCFIPLTFGGNIKSIEDIKERLKRGADKVVINTAAFENPDFITQAAKAFGRQCIVVGIDVKKNNEDEYQVYVEHGKKAAGLNPIDWARKVEKLGAGEIFLNSIDRDGTAQGYDVPLIKMITDAVSIPVIACGGVGIFEHFVEGIEAGASAVSAGNIFNFTENSVIEAKKTLKREGIDIRPIINLN